MALGGIGLALMIHDVEDFGFLRRRGSPPAGDVDRLPAGWCRRGRPPLPDSPLRTWAAVRISGGQGELGGAVEADERHGWVTCAWYRCSVVWGLRKVHNTKIVYL